MQTKTFLRALGLLSLIGTGSCQFVSADFLFCDSGLSYTPTWPDNLEVQMVEPRYCPVAIDAIHPQVMSHSGWVWQYNPQQFENSISWISRPSGDPVTESQISYFVYLSFEPFQTRTQASHGHEWTPGGDSSNRCYDVAYYQMGTMVPNGQPYYVNQARTNITYTYHNNSPDCSGGGGGEVVISTSTEELFRKRGLVYNSPALSNQ